jgi:hypothetical protein
MSIEPEQSQPSKADIEIEHLLEAPTDPRDEAIAALQKEIENLKNKHDQDKFLWFLAAIAVFDVVALTRAENWAAPFVIGIIELIAVIVMADRCRVDVVAPLIDKLVGMVPKLRGKPGNE